MRKESEFWTRDWKQIQDKRSGLRGTRMQIYDLITDFKKAPEIIPFVKKATPDINKSNGQISVFKCDIGPRTIDVLVTETIPGEKATAEIKETEVNFLGMRLKAQGIGIWKIEEDKNTSTYSLHLRVGYKFSGLPFGAFGADIIADVAVSGAIQTIMNNLEVIINNASTVKSRAKANYTQKSPLF